MTEATAISFQTWIKRLKALLEDTGMNSVFPIEDGAAKDKHNLLDEFGCADIAMVKDWVIEWHVKGCDGPNAAASDCSQSRHCAERSGTKTSSHDAKGATGSTMEANWSI